MNIFAVSPDPVECAKALDDLRLNKMILETAQLICTGLRCRGSGMDLYKSTHVNHPCSIWVRENKSNYSWTFELFKAMIDEKLNRTGKMHACAKFMLKFADGVKLMPDGDITPFANCTPHKSQGVFDAYKLTLIDKWAADKRPPKWTNSKRPDWA